eukprot:6490607-Amphidinium_carterae.1
MTLNATSWKQVQAYREDTSEVPDVLCIQEHHRKRDSLPDASSWAQKAGLQSHFLPAEPGRLETTSKGGVALLVRKHIGMQPLQLDLDGTVLQHRLAAIHLQGVVRGGLAVFTFYGIAGAGVPGNLPLLTLLQEKLRQQTLPWIVGADWNISIAELRQLDFAGMAGGRLVASDSPTCTNGSRCIDYWLVCERLYPACRGLFVDVSAPTSPHSPVIMSMQGINMAETIPVAKRWKCFLAQQPVGCMRQPPPECWTWQQGHAVSDVSAAWKEWEQQAEQYLCAVHDKHGAAAKVCTGRAAGVSITQYPLAQVWQKHIHPRCSKESKAWLKLIKLLQDTRHGFWLVGRCHLQRRLAELTPEFEEALQPLLLMYQWFVLEDLVREFATCSRSRATDLLEAAQARNRQAWTASAYQGAQCWNKWAKVHLAGGAKELHKWCKRDIPPLQQPCMPDGEPNQAAEGLEIVRREWSDLWATHADVPLPDLAMPELPPMT